MSEQALPSKGVPPSSLSVVESFFGAQGSEVYDAIEHLPGDQAEGLRSHLFEHFIHVMGGLHGRTAPRLMQPIPSEYEAFRDGPLHIHEDTVFTAGVRKSVPSVGVLKHLSLYCDRTLVRDPAAFMSWQPFQLGESTAWLPRLADSLRQLEPIAPLIRNGTIALGLLPSADRSLLGGQLFYGRAGTEDPYVGQLIEEGTKNKPDLRVRLLQAYMYMNVEIDESKIREVWPEVYEVIKERYPYDLDEERLRELIAYATELRESALTPITSDPIIRHHLAQNSRVLMREPLASPASRSSAFTTPISYEIPDLSSLSFEQIADIRGDLEIFGIIRTALNSLVEECAAVERPDSFEDYRAYVHAQAEAIVSPSFEELRHIERSTKAKKFLKQITVKTATFDIDGIIQLILEGLDLRQDPLVGGPEERRMRTIRAAGGVLASISK